MLHPIAMDCQVVLDDEIVNFEGGLPEKLSDLLLFFDDFLAQQQKTLKKVFVDHVPLQKAHFSALCGSFSEIKCLSQEKTDTLRPLLENFQQEITRFYKVLSFDLGKILSTSQKFIKQVKEILLTLERENYLLFILQIPLYSQWMQTFVQCLEDKDIGTLIDLEEFALIPLIEETYKQSYGA